MKSVRTNIPVYNSKDFKKFLEANNLGDLFVGVYEDIEERWYTSTTKICYAYSEKDMNVVANLTYIMLKYSNIENAYINNNTKR